MAHHLRNLHKRQDPGVLPSASGIGAATVAQAGEATAATLALDGAPPANPTDTDQVVNLSVSVTGTIATSPASTPTDNSTSADSSTAPSSSAAVASGSSEISLGTVIGACIGAFAGAIFIILVGLWLYKRGNKPRPRSPSNARKAPTDKERAWGKIEEDDEDRWEGQDGKPRQKEIHSVGPMEKLTMFKKSTPSMRTTYTNTSEPLPPVQFDHPFAQYHPNLAKELAEDNGDLGRPPQRPFLARVEVAPISWDGDTVGRDSFLSLGSNNGMSPGTDLALPTPKLTSSEPHRWESAEVMSYDDNGDALPRGRASSVAVPELRKSSHNPFFGASTRMSTHSTRSRSRSQSRSRTPSFSSPSKTSLSEADPATMPMPAPPPPAFTREEKGKYRPATPPSPTSSMAPSTITGHGGVSFSSNNPFSDAHASDVPPFKSEHISNGSHDRALASLIAALGPAASVADVQERLRVASMNPSVMSAYTEASEYAEDAMRESWPVPPSRPSPDSH